jgi:hypothetical protein
MSIERRTTLAIGDRAHRKRAVMPDGSAAFAKRSATARGCVLWLLFVVAGSNWALTRQDDQGLNSTGTLSVP